MVFIATMTDGGGDTIDPLLEISFDSSATAAKATECSTDAAPPSSKPSDPAETEMEEELLTAASVFPEDDDIVFWDGMSRDAVEFAHVSAEAAHAAAAAAAAATAANIVTAEPAEIFSCATGKDIPETPQELDFVDQMLAHEFNQLSVEEKDRVLFEIHGIASDDDPPDLESYYVDLERHLSEIQEKEALEAAKYYNADYVKGIRLSFLRSVRFNAQAAAERMVKHFDSKRFLFGEREILAREIRYSDLCEGDIKMLESGFIQILPHRDAAGRSILFVRPGLQIHALPFQEHATRAMWYMLSTTLQDEETQRKGIVVVLVGKHECAEYDIRTMQKFIDARESLPKKIVGIHLCSDDPAIRKVSASSKLHIMSKEMRLHLRPHIYEDPKQIIFELHTFGIPITEEYLKPNAAVNVAWHREWLEIRKSQEHESKESPTGVILPRKFDVLFGRGKNTREHTGNLRCTLLVEMHMEQYEKASKFEKTMVAERIVSMVEESLGRFLKFESNKGWVEVSREEAREKVSHFFRFQRSKKVNDGSSSSGDDNGATATTQAQHAKRVTPCASPELMPQLSSSSRAVKRKSFNEEDSVST